MVSNGTDGVRRLPDEAFAAHARRPDPSRDEHAAFPDEGRADVGAGPASTSGLPPSAWAPPPGQAYEPWPTLHRGRPWPFTLLHAAPRPRWSRRRRSCVAALLLGGVLYSGVLNEVMGGEARSTSGSGFEIRSTGADGPTLRDVVEVPFDLEPVILPSDQTTAPLPTTPPHVRVEVAGDEPGASITITAATDSVVAEASLPYSLEFALVEVADGLSVSVRSGPGSGWIQCRVYADGFLVAIGTGEGTADCVARPAD